MTESWNKNIHSKVSFKGRTMTRDNEIKMFILKYILKQHNGGIVE